jgi:tRNA-Thr(GGU) m(6)t(6)A37 methyltransferase TsaA
VIAVVNWRERLHLRSAKEARDEALRALPDVIGDLTPIAAVRNNITDTGGRTWAQETSELVFRDEFVPALDGLDGFTHVFVLTWLDQVTDEGRALLRIHPTGDESSPEVGVFATRTAHRPNPIAVSVVPLEGVRGNIVRVIGLDVASGTPVLDIKPYVSFYDSFTSEIPSWAE